MFLNLHQDRLSARIINKCTVTGEHCNKSKISCSFVPKEMCRKCYIIEQISDTLHEIQLYNVHLMYLFRYRKFNFFCSGGLSAWKKMEHYSLVELSFQLAND